MLNFKKITNGIYRGCTFAPLIAGNLNFMSII